MFLRLNKPTKNSQLFGIKTDTPTRAVKTITGTNTPLFQPCSNQPSCLTNRDAPRETIMRIKNIPPKIERDDLTTESPMRVSFEGRGI